MNFPQDFVDDCPAGHIRTCLEEFAVEVRKQWTLDPQTLQAHATSRLPLQLLCQVGPRGPEWQVEEVLERGVWYSDWAIAVVAHETDVAAEVHSAD